MTKQTDYTVEKVSDTDNTTYYYVHSPEFDREEDAELLLHNIKYNIRSDEDRRNQSVVQVLIELRNNIVLKNCSWIRSGKKYISIDQIDKILKLTWKEIEEKKN